jgi:aryl-alcohol dehydrogenase-like predicted oxidoreductase
VKHTILPGTELAVSRLSFGTGRLHRIPTGAQRQAILAAAVSHGFTHFDTAPYYGFGIAEAELGRFLRGAGAEVTVASKVGLYPPGGRGSSTLGVWTRKVVGKLTGTATGPVLDWSLGAATRSLEESLRTLGRDRLDILFLHEPAIGLFDVDELYGWLERQADAGKIRYWGLAGPLERFEGWTGHRIASVLQVRDGPDGATTRRLAEHGREPQLTFGALPAAIRGSSATETIRAALLRNPRGSVLVSSRHAAHVRELAAVAGAE